MAELGLNDHHVLQALNFIRFSRYKRIQRLRAVNHCFQDLKDSRLYEDTYTLDEVNEMLEGLLAAVRGEMESELLNSSHTSVLLLRQLLTQAEKWHLKLAADMSELENRELLEQIADFEERETRGAGSAAPDFSKQKLLPLNETGGVALLQREIERLQTENEQLLSRGKSLETHLTTYAKDNETLKNQIKGLGAKPAATTSNAAEMQKLETQMSSLRTELSTNIQTRTAENEKLASELTATMHEMLKVQEQLEMTEKELDKKFRETGAYKNLRDMLAKKNEQIKDLRKKLGKYETLE